MKIHQLDLRTRQVTDIPDSAALWTPRLSPDGRYVAAVAVDPALRSVGAVFPGSTLRPPGLWLFDVKSQKWTRFVPIANIQEVVWATDSRYVYFNTADDAKEVYRVRIANGRVDPIVSLRSLSTNSEFAGVTPDGSPLVTHSFSVQEVYALDVDWP
jgi:hypothetical protein